MDQQEQFSHAEPTADANSLGQQLRQLRTYLTVTLVAVIVVVFCFNVFLYRLDRSTRTQVLQTTKLRSDLEQTVGVEVSMYLSQVINFAQTHPDVAQILARYGLKLGPSNAVVVAPTTAAPVATPKSTAPAAGTAPKK